MARMNWKTTNQNFRLLRERKTTEKETRHLVNKVCLGQRVAEEKRRKEDVHRAMILQAAIKAGIYRGRLPVGPTIRSKDAPKEIRQEQHRRSFFKTMSHSARSDKAFKKENREWNEGNLGDGASLNPV